MDMQFFPLVFDHKRREYGSTYTFRFYSPEPFPFTAGQWLHVSCGEPEISRSTVRHLSIASAPSDPYLEFSMDLASESLYKQKMAQLEPGATVQVFKLIGDFTVPLDTRGPLVFIAGGLGMVPFRSLIRDLAGGKRAEDWQLLQVSRDFFLYEDEISTYMNPQIRVSRKELDSVWPKILKDKAVYYVCGSERFLEGMSERLAQSGVSEDQIRTENFH